MFKHHHSFKEPLQKELMQAQHFHVSYCYGSQENFLKALREGKYEEAEAVLERVPYGRTVKEELERHLLLKEGYCMLTHAYKDISSLRLKEINVASTEDLEKLVEGHKSLREELEEEGGEVRGVEDVYQKAIELLEQLKDDLSEYEEFGDSDEIKEKLRELDEIRSMLSS